MSTSNSDEESYGPYECLCYKCQSCNKIIYEKYYNINHKLCQDCDYNDYQCQLCEHKGTCVPDCCNNNWKKCHKCGYTAHEDDFWYYNHRC